MSVLVSDAPTLIGDVGEDNNVKVILSTRLIITLLIPFQPTTPSYLY